MGTQTKDATDSQNINSKSDIPKEEISIKSLSELIEIKIVQQNSKDLEIEDLTSLTLKNEKCQKVNCQCKMTTKRVNQPSSVIFGRTKMIKSELTSKTQSNFDIREMSPPKMSSLSLTSNLISKTSNPIKINFNLKELTLDFKSLATKEQSSTKNNLFLFTAKNSENILPTKKERYKREPNRFKSSINKQKSIPTISDSDDSDEELSEGLKKFNFSSKLPNNTTTPSSTTLTSNCSREALVGAEGGGLVSGEDDWSMVDLEGYFENLCHIPKKMSAMAMMMYT